MKKAAGIVAGVVVVVGAIATGGAWYTGTQLEGVLQNAVAQANQQFQTSTIGPDGQPMLSLQLASVERHWFSTTAHYRLAAHGKGLGDDGEIALLFVDHIEHGPLPFSRLKALNLMPVMATSNITLQPSPITARWYTLANGAEPFSACSTVRYGGAVQSSIGFAPLAFKSPEGALSFSGATADLSVAAQGENYSIRGKSDDLQLNTVDQQGMPVKVGYHGWTFDMGGKRGDSGFYLGPTDTTVASLLLQAEGKPGLQIQGLSVTSRTEEANGMLAFEAGYAANMINLADTPLGSAKMSFKLDQFDIPASKSLYHLFQTQIAPQQRAAVLAGVPFTLRLSAADEQQMKVDVSRLLSGKPHIELQDVSLKTPHGEGHMSLSVNLSPVPMGATAVAPFGGNMIGAVDAKVLLPKAMLNDLGVTQAHMLGLVDPAAIAQQGKNVSDMVSSLAVMLQLGKVDGDNVVSNLHYADGLVDFNGQKMTPQQLYMTVLGRFTGAAH